MEPNSAVTFEKKYQEWKSYCVRPEVAEQSSDAAYINNAPFQDIVALGDQAVPYIIEKLRTDPEAHFLIHALERITHHKFTAEEIEAAKKKYGTPLGNQGYAKMWIDWWEAKQNKGA